MKTIINEGCSLILILLVVVVGWISSGFFLWDKLSPNSFWGAIKFIFLWSISGYAIQSLGIIIISILIGLINRD